MTALKVSRVSMDKVLAWYQREAALVVRDNQVMVLSQTPANLARMTEVVERIRVRKFQEEPQSPIWRIPVCVVPLPGAPAGTLVQVDGSRVPPGSIEWV